VRFSVALCQKRRWVRGEVKKEVKSEVTNDMN
jgi:hypothetical protein